MEFWRHCSCKAAMPEEIGEHAVSRLDSNCVYVCSIDGRFEDFQRTLVGTWRIGELQYCHVGCAVFQRSGRQNFVN